jgi:tRNA 2-thiouridine synthesizing protein A
MADFSVDARGLSCPLPVLKARRTLRELPSGSTVEVLSTDPNSLEDFPSFCRAAGHELLEAAEVEDAFRFVIKKGQG